MAMFSKDLGIDLGTMFTRLADATQVLAQQPTIVAIETAEPRPNFIRRGLRYAPTKDGGWNFAEAWLFEGNREL